MIMQKGRKGMEKCPECGCDVKRENLDRHMNKVHASDIGNSAGVEKNELSRTQIRKELELKRKKARMNIFFSVVVITLIFVGVYILFLRDDPSDQEFSSYTPTEEPPAQVTSEKITIPLSDINEKASFFPYETGSKTIRYFAVRGTDGKVHTALDACDLCYEAKMGYSQNEDMMKCNNCGQEFSIDSIGTENLEGGCWPSYLPADMDQNEMVLSTSDLKEKSYMF